MYIKGIERETELGEELLLSDNIVVLGAFDGLHEGHMSLIKEAMKSAEVSGARSCVFALTSLPGNSLRITSDSQRSELLCAAGVDLFVTQSFTERFRRLKPEEFFEKYIAGALNAKSVITGFNYSFGCMGIGNNTLLTKLCAEAGIEHIVIPPIINGGLPVSSTRIRSAVRNGDLLVARQMLGRYFSLRGIVVESDKIGRSIGFPTANLQPCVKYVMPPHGVYSTIVKVDGAFYDAVTNCGGKPMIREGVNIVETHIINFDGDLYGCDIEVYFVERICDIVKFLNIFGLSACLDTDVNISKIQILTNRQ